MGIIIGKFRKKKSALEVLETLENEIKEIEDYRRNTEQAHKKTVGRFILFSVLIYLLTAFLFYFYFFPASIYDRLFYIIPLIFAPVIIISVKRGLTWYYNRKISRNQTKLKSLKEEKKKVLDKVMDTETYKTAKVILEKYAPEQIRKTVLPSSMEITPFKPNVAVSASVTASSPSVTTPGLRQRALPGPSQMSRASFGGVPLPMRTPYGVGSSTSLPARASLTGTSGGLMKANVPGTPLPLPRAILPRERSVLDKMVDYLVGDGPSNRYALICRQCFGHNGMAVREEFEYISFKCCYCYAFNPARKQRPTAPKLQFDADKSSRTKRFSSSDSPTEDSDTDIETTKGGSELETTTGGASAKLSDNEKASDYDKLSDLDVKSSDNETSKISDNETSKLSDSEASKVIVSDSDSPQPMEVDNSLEKTFGQVEAEGGDGEFKGNEENLSKTE